MGCVCSLPSICSFVEKAHHAQAAGALAGNCLRVCRCNIPLLCYCMWKSIHATWLLFAAVIIYDSDEENDSKWIDMVRVDEDYPIHIPVFFMLGTDGRHLQEALTRHTVTITLPVNESSLSIYE